MGFSINVSSGVAAIKKAAMVVLNEELEQGGGMCFRKNRKRGTLFLMVGRYGERGEAVGR